MLLEITIAIIVAKFLNLLFQKLRQPGVLGEIFAGIILGPCCIGLLSGMSFTFFNITSYKFQFDITNPEFKEIALIGAIFLLFIVGMETRFNDLKKVKKAGFLVAIFSVIIPFFVGCLVGLMFRMTLLQSMAIGAIFNATSATMAIRIFGDMDFLSTRVGLTLKSAIVFNDILAILIFAVVFGSYNSLPLLLMQIILFFVLAISLGYILLRYTEKKNITKKTPMVLITSALMICFLFSLFAENMGLTAIIGAFVAGLFVGKMPQANVILDNIKIVGNLFFIPLFFVWVGSSVNLLYIAQYGQLEMVILFIVVFVSFALMSNFLGGKIGAKLSGLKKKESTSIGIGMMPVMGVALIIITTGIDKGMFGAANGLLAHQIRTATLLLIITSCFITPSLLKRSMKSPLEKRLLNIKQKTAITERTLSESVLKLKKKEEKQNMLFYYFLGMVTLIICGLEILNSSNGALSDKFVSILGVFIGIISAYLVIRYYRRLVKRVSYILSET